VDVRDFLQLERALERDRVVQPAAEEERVLLRREALGPGDQLRLERERRADRARQVTQLRAAVVLGLRSGRPRDFASVSASRNSAVSCVLNAFVEATPISTPARVRKCSFVSRIIALVATLQIASVRSWPSERACLSAGERVGGLARLGNDHDERARAGDAVPVPVFARDLDLRRQACERLDPVFRRQPA
jgi:hypothetical protein